MACNCCNNTYQLGCFDPCGIQFVSGAVAPVGMAGVWTLYIKFRRRTYAFANNLIEGQAINFSVRCLNAEYTYKAYIVNPSGEQMVLDIDGTGYDCLEFSTKYEAQIGINVGASSIS